VANIAEKRTTKASTTGARRMTQVMQDIFRQKYGWNPLRRKIVFI
jgi:hypothetical protein